MRLPHYVSRTGTGRAIQTGQLMNIWSYRCRLVGVLLTCLASLALNAITPGSARAETQIAVSYFYTELGADGYWVDDTRYGTVWYPRERSSDWQPYVYGRWVYTSDYGWYWESDEPWGWAAYHYGRWVYTAQYGWVWVPDDEWGPSWVEWRYGDGYVGWAPMPPEERWHNGAFVSVNANLTGPAYNPQWVFVEQAQFANSDVRAHRMPASRNAGLIQASARTTNYTVVSGRIVNRSIDVAKLSAATHVEIRPSPVTVSGTPAAKAVGGVRGGVKIYRPQITARNKLNLDVPLADYGARGDNPGGDLPVPKNSDVGLGGNSAAGRGVGAAIDRSVGGIGGGIGGGLGGGGGLRIGR